MHEMNGADGTPEEDVTFMLAGIVFSRVVR